MHSCGAKARTLLEGSAEATGPVSMNQCAHIAMDTCAAAAAERAPKASAAALLEGHGGCDAAAFARAFQERAGAQCKVGGLARRWAQPLAEAVEGGGRRTAVAKHLRLQWQALSHTQL